MTPSHEPVDPRIAKPVLASALDWLAEGRRVALATVLQTWGSAPVPPGSQLAIDGEGNFVGSVSGGCVEGAVIAEATEAMASGKLKTLQFSVADDTAWAVGLACGGAIRIFVEPLVPGQNLDVLAELARTVSGRKSAALVTDLASGTHSLALKPSDVRPELRPALHDAFARNGGAVVEGKHGDVLINVFSPPVRLVVVGAVHVAQALVKMARLLGHEVVVVDPRSAFATQMRFGDVTIKAEWPGDVLPGLGIDARTAVVALSHESRIDEPALIHALKSDAFYVGAMGSKKTHAGRVARLAEAGVAPEAIARIHAPIGLDIGATGPAEIALSIIAEITAAQRGKDRGRA
jgi:xanthine dehydrogenase accessory factor